MTIVALGILTGLLTGVMSGMLGIGGGAIMVVIAVFALNVTQHVAQGAALAAIIPTACIAVYKHHKNGLVDFKIGLFLAIGGMFGSFLGAYGANMLDETLLSKIFSVFFLLIGVQLLLSSYNFSKKNNLEVGDKNHQ